MDRSAWIPDYRGYADTPILRACAAYAAILGGKSARVARPSAIVSYPASLASHTLTHERGSGQAAIVELCNLDGFDYVTSSGRAGDCVRLYTRYMRVLTHA